MIKNVNFSVKGREEAGRRRGAGPGPKVAAGWSSSTNCSPAASASTGEQSFTLRQENMVRSNQVPNPKAATMPTQLLPRPLHGRTGGLCQETGMQDKKSNQLDRQADC